MYTVDVGGFLNNGILPFIREVLKRYIIGVESIHFNF